jgi:hypothetical protein
MGETRNEAVANRVGHDREHDWNCPCLGSKGAGRERGQTEDRVGPQIDKLFANALVQNA